MLATPSTATPTARQDSAAGPPDLAVLAREAVISFLKDPSGDTAKPETPSAAAPEPLLPAPARSAAGDGASPASGILAAAAELGMKPADMISAAGFFALTAPPLG
jgi:hypothetical protein